MPISLTFGMLTVSMALAIALRVLWPRFSRRTRRVLQVIAAVLVVPCVLTFVTKWDVTNHRVNDVEAWIRIVACQFALVFFTLLRPRMLTTAVAVVLLPFAFATAVSAPLSALFRPEHFSATAIADGYVLETVPWHSDGGTNSGVDFSLNYRPAHTAGVRRGIVGTRFYSTQCNTAAVYAVLKPATHVLDVFCPRFTAGRPLAELSGSHDHYVIPKGALSPALRRISSK